MSTSKGSRPTRWFGLAVLVLDTMVTCYSGLAYRVDRLPLNEHHEDLTFHHHSGEVGLRRHRLPL